MFSLETSFLGNQNLFLCYPFLALCFCFHSLYFPDLLLLFISLLGLFLSLLVDPCPHLQSFFLDHHFQWWRLLGNFGLDLWWFRYMDNYFCLMGSHIRMSLLLSFLPPLHFHWCHHRAHLRLLKIFHILHFLSRFLCLWLGYLGSPQNWIHLGHLWILLLSAKIVYSGYYLIIYR